MHFICYMNIFYRFGKRDLEARLASSGLDMPGLIALLVIGQVPGISQSRLNQFLGMDKGNLSKFLRRLESEGLIQRQAEPEGGLHKLCQLTPSGQALLPQLAAILQDWQQSLQAGISTEDWQTFERVSEQVTANLLPAGSLWSSQKEWSIHHE